MRKRTTLLATGVVALTGVALGGAAVANATAGDDGAKLTGSTLQQASAAALKATGGGKVNETEHDSEKGATYEVEVRKPDGSQVDVRLDGSFNVVAIDGDHDKGADADESGK